MTDMNVSQIEGITVVKLMGELTHMGTPAIERGFVLEIGAVERAVVDLSAVTMITTPGITMIIAADRQLRRKGGTLVVCGFKGTIEEVMRRGCFCRCVSGRQERSIAAGGGCVWRSQDLCRRRRARV